MKRCEPGLTVRRSFREPDIWTRERSQPGPSSTRRRDTTCTANCSGKNALADAPEVSVRSRREQADLPRS